ncbi:hypothetical protein M8C17_15895 [Micromonospora sp. RHAY321]|uniref:hypothetical protein n=1 Tax=Micromonospora sp. RHAY321 TaxID=2944807 RepID=UPI00207D1CC2|nr:hypothetical protein [Micromonospora sp. RHAY321]MCO1596640.1 hypothetical protein [Micromonospora sp. RHAY321]
MRGDLDETLARLARREEALRRRANDRDDSEPPPGPVGGPVQPAAGRTDARNAGPGRHDARHAGRETQELAGWGPVEEVAEAVRQVVGAHPGLAVTVRVEHAGRTYPLRVSWNGPDVTVGPEPSAAPVAPPPAWPLSGRTVPAWAPGPDGLTPDPAARLAELIRRDPSLLDELDPRR